MNEEIIDNRPLTKAHAYYWLKLNGIANPTDRQINILWLLGRVVKE